MFRFAPESEPFTNYDSERMWVTVKRRCGDHWLGVLDNKPHLHDAIQLGDELHFHTDNVLSVSNENA